MNESVEYVIRVVLKARDQLAATLAKARAEIEAFEASARDADDSVAGLGDRITSLNKRAASASETLGRLKKQTDEYGGSVRELIKGEDDGAKATERRGKSIDDVTKIEIRSAGEQRRAREETEKGTASAKKSAAAQRESAKERAANTRVINEHAKSLGLDAKAENELDKALKAQQKTAKAAGIAFREKDREMQAAIKFYGEESDLVKENAAEHKRLGDTFEAEKAKREELRSQLSAMRGEHRALLDQAKAEIEAGQQNVAVEKEEEIVVKKTTTAKKQKRTASKQSSDAVKEDTNAIKSNTEELVKNADAEDKVIEKKKYRKTVLTQEQRGGVPVGSEEAKAAIARVKAGGREGSVKPASDADLEDLLAEELGGFSGFGGGAARKPGQEEALSKARVARLAKEKESLTGVKSEYEAFRTEVGKLTQEYRKGDRDLDSFTSRIDNIAKRLDVLTRKAARTTIGGNFADDLRKRTDELRALADPSSEPMQAYAAHRVSRGIDPEPLKKSEVAAEDLNRTIRTTDKELDGVYNAGRRAGRGVDEFASGSKKAVREAETLGQAFGTLSARIDHTGGGVAALDNRLRGLLVLGIIAFSQQFITALISVGGSLVSVASSAAMAGGAIGGALTAGIAEALPVLGLFAASLGRVKEVMTAVQQSQLVDMQHFQRRNDNQKKDANAADQVASAQDQVSSAEERVAEANRTLADRQKALTQARIDAVKKIRDLIAAEHDAELAAMGAAKSQADAQDALRKAVATGDVTGVGGAELDVLQATQQRRESVTALADSRQAAGRAQRGGVAGDPGVVQARQQVADATRGVADAEKAAAAATRALDKAQRGSAFAAADQFSGLEKLNWLLQNRLSPAERELYRRINELQKVYKSQFRPVTDILISEYSRYVSTATKMLRDPAVINSAKGLATGITGQMERVRKAFSSNEFMRQLLRIIAQARRDLGPVTSIIINLGKAFANVAEEAGPSLHRILEYIKGLTDQFLNLTNNQGKLKQFFDGATTQLIAWANALVAVVGLFAALAGIGQSSGLTMVQDFTKQVNQWTQDIQSNSSGVAKFFEDSRKGLYILLQVAAALGKAMFQVFDPSKMGQLAQFLTQTLLPALVFVIKRVSEFTSGLLAILNLPVVRNLTQFILVFLLLSKAVTSVSLLYQGLIDHLGKFFRILETFKGGRALTGFLQVAGDHAGGLLTKIGELIKRIPGLSRVGDALAGTGTKIQRSGPITAGRGGGTGGQTTVLSRDRSASGAAHTTPEEERRLAAEEERAAAARRTPVGRVRTGAKVIGGAALVAGGVAASMAGQDDFRGATQGLGLAVKQLAGLSQQLTSLDFGGALHTLFGGTSGKEFEDFAKGFDDNVKRMAGQGDIAGLEKLTKHTRDLAKEFPLYADSLNAAADQTAQMVEQLKALGPLPNVIKEAFRKNRISPLDIADKNAAAQFLDNLKRLRTGGVDNIKDLRSNLQFNIDKITSGFKSGSAEASNAMSDNFRWAFRNLKQMARDGTITHGQYMRQMAKLTSQQMQYMRDNMDTMSAEAKGRFADNMHQATQAAIAEAGGIEHATEKALKHIRNMMSTEFEAYGLDPESARRLARNRTTKGRENIDQFGRNAVPSSGQGGAAGFLGQMGERGADMYHMVLGRGEAVLNWAHQKVVNSALWNQYGMMLPDLFKRTKGMHGTEWQGGKGGMASGGFVAMPGTNFSQGVEPKIVTALRRLGQLMHATIYGISGYRSPQHSIAVGGFPNDPHTRGEAADIGVNSAMRSSAAQLSDALLRRVGLYRPFYPASAAEINHVQLLANAAKSIIGSRAGTAATSPAVALAAIKKLRAPHIDGGGQFGLLAQLGVNTVTRAANMALRNAVQDAGAVDTTGGGGRIPAFHGPWVQVMNKIAAAKHWSLSAWRWLVNAESGGHVSIRNPSSGAFGLGQFLGATLREYTKYGAASPRGEDQIRAMAQYISDRYGNPDRAKSFHIANNWYDKGGEIDGPHGHVKPIFAHGGEWILNKTQQLKAAALAGLSREGLRSMLGFHGGPTSFAGGGDTTTAQPSVKQDQNALDRMFTTAFETARRKAIRVKGIYNLPEILPQAWDGIISEIGRATSLLHNHASNWNKRINALTQVIRDDELGLLNILEAARQRQANTRARALTFRQYAVSTVHGVLTATQQRDPVQVAGGAVANARDDLSDIRAEESTIRSVQAVVNRRLATLRRGGVSSKEASQVRRLQAQLVLLGQKFQDIRDAEATALTNLYEAQVAAQQATVDKINADADKSTTFNSLLSRMASALGNTDWLSKINAAQRDVLSKQADDLAGRIQSARAIGNNDLADQLQAQVDDLRTQVFESVQADIQAAADQVNNQAQRRLGRIDLFGRMSDALGKVGLDSAVNVAGEVLTQRGVFQARQDALVAQRTGLQSVLQDAMNQQNVGLIQSLTDQLAELDVTIQENSKALFDARVADVNRVTDQATKVIDYQKQILDLQGAISGVTDIAGELSLEQQRTGALQSQRDQLQSLLAEAVAAGNDQAVIDLTNQLYENQIALLTNTQAINDLNGQTQSPQSFTSSAWQWFRDAIFTGMGGVMPQYVVPGAATGGIVTKSGLVYVHTGEPIQPASIVPADFNGGGGDHIETHIHSVDGEVPLTELVSSIAWAKKTAQVRKR